MKCFVYLVGEEDKVTPGRHWLKLSSIERGGREGETVVESGLSTCLADTEQDFGRTGGASVRSSVALLALSLS